MESFNNSVVLIRHGEPKRYLDKKEKPDDFDLTAKGVEQAKETATQLFDSINSKYDRIIVVSSPAPRAEDTALAFIEQYNQLAEAELKLNKLKLDYANVRSVRPMDIKDMPTFLDYMKVNSTDVYGELWLTGAKHAEKSEFVESRKKVDARANSFLRHVTSFLLNITKKTKENTCVIVFSHFELGTNILKALYTDQSQFPIVKSELGEEGEQVYVADKESQNYAEPIIIEPSLISKDGVEEKVYTITAPSRGGLTRTVKLINSENRFTPVEL